MNGAIDVRADARGYLVGCLLVLAGGFVLSLGAFCIRFAAASEPWHYLFWRGFGFTLALLAVATFRGSRSPWRQVASLSGYGWLAAFGLAASMMTFITALKISTLAEVFFLASISPLITACLALPLLGERVGLAGAVAIALGLGGVYLMSGGTWTPETMSLGAVLALCSAFTFALYTLSTRGSPGSDRDATLLVTGGLIVSISGIAMFVVGLDPLALPREIAIAVAHGAVLLSAGMFLFGQGSRTVKAVVFTTLAQSESVLAPLWGYMFFQETPTFAVLAGGALILLAVVLQAIDGARR